MVELGVTALCVPEERGGFGCHVPAAAATAGELAAALHGSPFAGLSAAAHVLAGADDPAATEVLDGVLAGEVMCALGRADRDGRTARAVDGAPDADALVLLTPGGGARLLPDRSGWATDPAPYGFDVSRRCSDVTVEPDHGRPLTAPPDAAALFGLLLAADAVGCVQRMLDRTVAYAGQRQAFGRPIGGFQAVQHRLADHAVRTRGMTLLVADAAAALAASAPEAGRAVTLAELSVSTTATHVLHDLVQLTGGIGFTWEHGLHLYERRAHHDARLGANPRAAVRALAEQEGWADGA